MYSISKLATNHFRFEFDEDFLSANEDRMISDGIYDVTNIDFVQFDGDLRFGAYSKTEEGFDEVLAFIEKYSNEFVIACAYQSDQTFLLAQHPHEFKGTKVGSGFNHGSCNLITSCPESLLILAEDD